MPLLELSKLDHARRDIVFRVDVNEDIGAGHSVRCMAIADCIERVGGTVLFVVSNSNSASTLLAAGKECVVIPGNPMHFGSSDGRALASLCRDVKACSVLVDSYAVTDSFFKALNDMSDGRYRIAWIDDLYTYELGEQRAPTRRQVDCLVNYSLGMSLPEYEEVYADQSTNLCISPRFAPLRPQFSPFKYRKYGMVGRIMVTTGSTNEGHMLERMARCCLSAVPDARIDVIVGSLASFKPFDDDRIMEHRDVTDLSPFMRNSDICICAAGTTLYELCSVGVPSIAIPIVENQMPNAVGFKGQGLGYVVHDDSNFESCLKEAIGYLASDALKRETLVSRMHETVDGKGAERIASELFR